MKLHHAVMLFSLLAFGCAQPKWLPPAEKLSIELPQKTLTLKPTRNDITIGAVLFRMYPDDVAGIRVNAAKPRSNIVRLKQVGPDTFEFPAMKIEFDTTTGGPIFCMSLKAYFNEATNMYDGRYYANLDDRYALFSWCSADPVNTPAESRFKQNRLYTVGQFRQKLSEPIVIRLNDEPLKEEFGRYPMVYGGPRNMTEADWKPIQQAVEARGEKFVTAISINGPGRAVVNVGDGSFLNNARVYTLMRKGGAWEIETVKDVNE